MAYVKSDVRIIGEFMKALEQECFGDLQDLYQPTLEMFATT